MRPTVSAPSLSRHRPGRATWIAAAALAAVALPAFADVYKWIDTAGKLHYTDRPPPADATLVSVEAGGGTHSQRAAPAPAPVAATPSPGAVSAPPPTPEEAARLRKGVDTDLASTRAAQCKSAQERYQKYITSRRIFREGANKERVYLSDAEADTERVNARREVEDFCADAPP
jgi:type IV secretory pathway VirB10-like protein